MPLFESSHTRLRSVEQVTFDREKKLQALVEKNLEVVFRCRLIESEFSTGQQHGGRIDTLALSEDGNPVIIEYKRDVSSALIPQSLYYLRWLWDHRGDFERVAHRTLEENGEINWSNVRVICIAPHYKKYDLHAAQLLVSQLSNVSFELWSYRLYQNGFLYFEEVLQKSLLDSEGTSQPAIENFARKNSKRFRGEKAYSFEGHLKYKSKKIVELARAVQEFMMGLDIAVREVPQKNYIAYKISQNIACMIVQKGKIIIFVKLSLSLVPKSLIVKKTMQDFSEKGHHGTGDLRISVQSSSELEKAKPVLQLAYQKIGG